MKQKPGPLAKIRRRLTVTGASQTIDGGVSKLSVNDKQQNPNILHTNVKCAVNEYSGVSRKGHAPYNPRKKNQDALVMTDDVATNTLILCVLDGHGEHGDAVAIAFQKELAKEMISHPAWKLDVQTATAEAIAKIEKLVIRDYRVDTEFSGTTLSMAIIRGNKITGVNIGDSRVIIGKDMGDGKLVAEEFTHDHKPDTPAEKERILAAGGRVFAVEYDDGIDGPPRVWLGHMDVPGLAMSRYVRVFWNVRSSERWERRQASSYLFCTDFIIPLYCTISIQLIIHLLYYRSLGDSVAHTAGVSSTPDFTERELDPATDRCIVVATDGLWEFVTNQETIDMVAAVTTPATSVEDLVKEANKRWMAEEQVIDDTTVITASLFGYMNQ